MHKSDEKYQAYVKILEEELIPAMGCTEPIAIAYAGAVARKTLGNLPEQLDIKVSGNIIKNVKSVIVPNTGGMRGIAAALCAGVIAGDAEALLEVIARVTPGQKEEIKSYMDQVKPKITPASTGHVFEIDLTVTQGTETARVRIVDTHTNIILIEKNGQPVFQKDVCSGKEEKKTDHSILNIEDIIDFANTVDTEDVKEVLERQIRYNTAISEEGLRGNYGANIGKVLLHTYGDNIKIRARAKAAAGSDARMNGCELPVVINSGSGNQGITSSVPVIVYARAMEVGEEKMLRALTLSNLTTIHEKTPIGRLSAYCGAVSAGAGAGAGARGGGVQLLHPRHPLAAGPPARAADGAVRGRGHVQRADHQGADADGPVAAAAPSHRRELLPVRGPRGAARPAAAGGRGGGREQLHGESEQLREAREDADGGGVSVPGDAGPG